MNSNWSCYFLRKIDSSALCATCRFIFSTRCQSLNDTYYNYCRQALLIHEVRHFRFTYLTNNRIWTRDTDQTTFATTSWNFNTPHVCVSINQWFSLWNRHNALRIISHALQGRHYWRIGVSNHRWLDCILRRLFRSKKSCKLCVTRAFMRKIHRSPMDSPQKGLKMFSIDDVIMHEKFEIIHAQHMVHRLLDIGGKSVWDYCQSIGR